MEINALKQRSRFRKYEADWQSSRRALFLQGDQSVANQAGAAFRADMNSELQAIVSNSSGASSPATTYAYQWWADTTNGLMKQRNAANTGWIVRSTLAETFVIGRASNTIIGVGDYGRTFNCTGTFTQTFTAAATLGDGFWCEFRNNGTGIITLDPNAAETIDGATTITLNPGDTCVVNVNGSVLITVGRTNAAAAGTAPWNYLVNGGADIAQLVSAVTLTTSAAYTPVDMVMGWASGGAVSAGTMTQDTAATIGRTGKALKFSGITLTGSGQISWRYRMEAADAVKLKNATASFQIAVLHDVGSNINYTPIIRKANSADNFGAVTVISTGSAVSVASATNTVLKQENVSLGDCSNGIEIEVQAACGAITTKNFTFTEWQLEEGLFASAYKYVGLAEALTKCQRYYYKTYDLGTAPGSVATAGAPLLMSQYSGTAATLAGGFSIFFKTTMRATPTVVMYSPDSGTSGKVRDIINSADVNTSSTGINTQQASFVANTSAVTTTWQMRAHLTADARL